MTKFYQPFQFIPVKGIHENKLLNYTMIKSNTTSNPARHDLWMGQQSGKIICTLTFETPTLLGLADDENNKDKRIKPKKRKFGTKNNYYIPGNTLRGLSSSIAEAVSQSSLRVLENTEIFVSIWQENKPRNLGRVHDYFAAQSPNLLPLGSKQRNSKMLTPAEVIFGCIEAQVSVNKHKDDPAFTLASRVKFSDAQLVSNDPNPLLDEIALKVLEKPKTNSHNMYYHHTNGERGFIKKGDLSPLTHSPNGRKFYLHATKAMLEKETWKYKEQKNNKKAPHIKQIVQPFKAGLTFTFHINFENLTEAELSLLITSLRPAKDFRHKLGMGKPLGLGTARIDTQGIYLIDRTSRYGINALQQERYSQLLLDTNSEREEDSFQAIYQEELKAHKTLKKENISINTELIDHESLEILKRIGKWPYSTEEDQYEIDYPYMENQNGEITGTGFEWFVKNEDQGKQQYLKSVEPDQPLPTLQRYIK